ncbi:hypothetical protein GCM10009754_07280 [Amycolatopsis minnesotensis]|uniref:Uncharacterized protein n=1 Tax=Amycolatopsis minnesotensis TaxID=337894 RepID=A0ABP5BE91_9PSEU
MNGRLRPYECDARRTSSGCPCAANGQRSAGRCLAVTGVDTLRVNEKEARFEDTGRSAGPDRLPRLAGPARFGGANPRRAFTVP